LRVWDTPNYWRVRAEEARALAEDIHNSEAKAGMLAVATSYEAIAFRHERTLAPLQEPMFAVDDDMGNFQHILPREVNGRFGDRPQSHRQCI
jgi:hypothetical protein